MIFGYINSKPTTKIYKQKQLKIERYVNRFNFSEIRFVTERNRFQLIHTIKQNEPYLFITTSFKEISNDPTSVAELIISIINLNVSFVEIETESYFDINNKSTVYPIVFDYYKAHDSLS